ncbi:glycosyltransferase family 4 protein [Flavobacterium sp.]|uniref:glycosyltransferase family 4 protein n=1 Tax=Flavobacterium sp. TaxID=239 RepID=UPI003750B332
MRVLQIIDSLDAGGAERMAVNYANALAHEIDFSGLVVTRKEGPLLSQIDDKVKYLCLNKKGTFDFKSLFYLKKFVRENQVKFIHAHSTSFFIAFLLKLLCPNLKLIWHDHYGDSEFLSKRPSFVLKITIPFFSKVIAVNHKLKDWVEQKLNFKKVVYLPNFPTIANEVLEKTILKGNNEKRIVCLANLREQKNHVLLLKVAEKLKKSHTEWTFHLVGKDFEDDYSKYIKELISKNELKNNVYCYGTREDIKNILDQSQIGILTSSSEGLPIALLEYGLYKKPVVVTNVGEIPLLIVNYQNGFSVVSNDEDLFYTSLVKLIDDHVLMNVFGEALYKTVYDDYSKETIIKKYINWLQNEN